MKNGRAAAKARHPHKIACDACQILYPLPCAVPGPAAQGILLQTIAAVS
jgi:hypothetical protein